MKRPNGSTQLTAGVIIGLAGGVLILAGLFSNASSSDVDAVVFRSNLMSLGVGSISVAALLLAVGWIIQAISFLPGKGDASFLTSQPPLELTGGEPADVDPIDENPSPMAWALVLGAVIAALAVMFLLLS